MTAKTSRVADLNVQLNGILEQANLPVMMLDNDLIVNYVNKATLSLFKKYEAKIQQQWPKFKSTKTAVLGQSINGIYQTIIDPKNSFENTEKKYWSTNINIGDLTFQAYVSTLFNGEGTPQGWSVEFKDLNIQSNQDPQLKELTAKLDAINKVQVDGTIITANENFLNTVGYTLKEIQNKHHSIFVEPKFKASAEYKAFWASLNKGKFESKEYKRLGKGGKEVWIQASYNPILDANGKPYKVVKFATDITGQKIYHSNTDGQINAIHKAQAVIEFNMDGTIITANENFLNTVGYTLKEIQNKHHSMFVEPEYKTSAEYKEFWEKLNRGEFDSQEYMRLGKNGKEIWIQASYNPILDSNGKPYKVVKFASDITEQKRFSAEATGQIEAISKAQAIIEFNMDGTIITANDNFLLEEIQNQHHSMFVEPEFKTSTEYKEFWEKLNRGEFESKQYKRLGKGGKEVWIQASYNPILDSKGNPFKVVKFATDITERKLYSANSNGQIEAIHKAQAVIEFNMDGTIITANENFLNLEEIQNQHHSMFVEPEYKTSAEYKEFWEKLNRGEFDSKEYRRIGKGGKEIWIQASYNPILDLNGNPYKVVKFASNITKQKRFSAEATGQIEAISKAQAVIEFNMDGTIITANENFLNTVGYTLEEIQNQHHSMFVEPAFKASLEYKEFWEQLNRGEFDTKEYKRLGKGGKEIWIQASYNPILDSTGKPFKVVKFASDVTEQKLYSANTNGQIEAIHKAQAVIEFNMDGTIITANENFLKTVGYSLEEIQNKHHSMFVEPEMKNSLEYKEFWEKLNQGEFESQEYKRIGKGGKEIWIQASYNPILNLNGKPYKVVKFASEVTDQKLVNANFSGQISAIGKAQAVIEFNMDGTIITANDNFLSTVGYELHEIQNQHHSMFAPRRI